MMLRGWLLSVVVVWSAVFAAGCSAPASSAPPALDATAPAVATIPSGDSASHLSTGDAAVERNDLVTAEKEYRDAAALDPRSAEAPFDLGNVYVRQGRLSEAVRAYEVALAIDPRMAEAQTNLGRVYYELGQLSKAADALGAALKLDPNDGKTLYMMAVVRIQQNDLSEAEALLIKARDADSSLPEVYYGLGVVYRLKGQKGDAISAFEKFLSVGPGQDPGAMAHARQELETLKRN
jgi:cytochrome c-type biogenesis protein CcmH/NrfG